MHMEYYHLSTLCRERYYLLSLFYLTKGLYIHHFHKSYPYIVLTPTLTRIQYEGGRHRDAVILLASIVVLIEVLPRHQHHRVYCYYRHDHHIVLLLRLLQTDRRRGVGIQPSSNLQVLPTMAPTIPVPPDDVLMTLLKKAYYDAYQPTAAENSLVLVLYPFLSLSIYRATKLTVIVSNKPGLFFSKYNDSVSSK